MYLISDPWPQTNLIKRTIQIPTHAEYQHICSKRCVLDESHYTTFRQRHLLRCRSLHQQLRKLNGPPKPSQQPCRQNRCGSPRATYPIYDTWPYARRISHRPHHHRCMDARLYWNDTVRNTGPHSVQGSVQAGFQSPSSQRD